MTTIRAFDAYIPDAELAPRVVAPPISMLSSDQGEFSDLDPLSFGRFIGGLPSSMPREEAAAWLRRLIENETLRGTGPSFLIYELTMEGESALGLVGEVGLDAYDADRIKRHETTLADTEAGLAERLAAVRANGTPVSLAYRSSPAVHALLSELSAGIPDLHFTASDGVVHSIWVVAEEGAIEKLGRAYGGVGDLYITDGHHRMAAASRMAAQQREFNPDHHGAEAYNYAVAALFSEDQLRLRAFTRCVGGDIDLAATTLIAQLEELFVIESVPVERVSPQRRGEFGMVVEGEGYRLAIRDADLPGDPYRSLDVVFLQDRVLGPAFGIADPRSDPRLHFVSDRVRPDDVMHEHCWAWFEPYPALVSDVMAVADHGMTMPPKSTWFEPKLPSGLVVRLLD